MSRALPASKMVFGPDGNLYGTTFQGGAYGGGTIILRPHTTSTSTYWHQKNGQRQQIDQRHRAGRQRLSPLGDHQRIPAVLYVDFVD